MKCSPARQFATWFALFAMVPIGFAHAQGTQNVSGGAAIGTELRTNLPEDVVARVNGVSIGRHQLNDAVLASGQSDSPQLRLALKKRLIIRELLLQAAQREGFGRDPQVQQAKTSAQADLEIQLYIDYYLKPDPVGNSRVLQPITVTESEVRSRYDAGVAEAGPFEYKIRIISVSSDEAMKVVLAKLKAGVPFDQVASELSVAPSRVVGGLLLHWISFKLPPTESHNGGLGLPLAQAVSKLSENQVTDSPILVGNLRVVAKLDQKRTTIVPTYEDIKGGIRKSLELVARKQELDRLVKSLTEHAVIQQ
jgi:peptidyl-prolyl cis-trans isomerase C